ncbi:MAG: hypothetical protein QOJ67_686 [Acidimicrobiaceae bacterium]|jgi:hypothetical protein
MSEPQRNAPRRSRNQGRKPSDRQPRPSELWRATPEPPPAEEITPVGDPSALLRSLGPPPLTGQGATAEHYLAAVVARAAGLAAALAAAGDLLADPEAD